MTPSVTYDLPVFGLNLERQPAIEFANLLGGRASVGYDPEDYEEVQLELVEREGVPDHLRTTLVYADEDAETWKFTLTEPEPPRIAAYQWGSGPTDELPLPVQHAVYRNGYAIENVQTFPEYDYELERVRATARMYDYLRDEYESVPMMDTLFSVANAQFKVIDGVLRAKKVLTPNEYDAIAERVLDAAYGDNHPGSVTDFDNPLQIATLVHKVLEVAVDYLNSQDDRDPDVGDLAPDAILDAPDIDDLPQYFSHVLEKDEYLYAILLGMDGRIERFVFEEAGENAYVAQRHHDQKVHPYAVNALAYRGYEVVSHPDLEHGALRNPGDYLDRAIRVLESTEPEYSGDDIANFVFANAYRVVHRIRLLHAVYETLGDAEFRRRYEQTCSPMQPVNDQMQALLTNFTREDWEEMTDGNDRLQAVREDFHQFIKDMQEFEREAGWTT